MSNDTINPTFILIREKVSEIIVLHLFTFQTPILTAKKNKKA